MSPLALILTIVLILLLFGGLPVWGFHSYGYYPSGGIFLLILVVVVLAVSGRL